MRKIYCCAFFLLMMVLAHAQPAGYRAVIGPSPNASSYDKYGDIPVSTYTGVPDIVVPVYTIVNSGISVPVSLSYHSSGIRVDEEATRVGLGWVLNAGGMINRRVRDKDDFLYQYGYTNSPLAEFFDNEVTELFKRTSSNVSRGMYGYEPCKRTILGKPVDFSLYNDKNYDMEPDIFSYNFLGMTGRFVLKRNGEVVKEKEDALEIKLIDTTGTKWQFRGPDGTRYQFYKPETSTYYRPGPINNYETYITTWYLTKIISPTGAEVNFNYVEQGGISIESLFSLIQKDNIRSYTYETSNSPGCDLTHMTSHNPPGQSYMLILLESISYTHGSVSFEYDTRIDLKGDKRLSRIRVNNPANPAFSTSFELLQDYFTANSGGSTIPLPTINFDANLFNKRLKLTGVKQVDATGKAVTNYAFTYNEATLPPKHSYARDYWGYFNGQLGNDRLVPTMHFLEPFIGGGLVATYKGANREPHPQHAQAFLLKSIQYPTGGKSMIDYELNDYDQANSINSNSQVRYNDIDQDTASFSTRRITTVVDETFTFTIPPGKISGSKVDFVIDSRSGQTQTGTTYASDMYVEIYNSSNTLVRRYDLGLKSSWSTGNGYELYVSDKIDLGPGAYTVKTHVAPNVMFVQYMYLNFLWYKENNRADNHTIRHGGGNRVVRVTSQESPTSNRIIKKYLYSYLADPNNDGVKERYSTGKRLTELRFTSFDAVPSCIRSPDGLSAAAALCYAFNVGSENLISSHNPPVGYDSVWVLNGESGEGGMTRFDYENVPGMAVAYGTPDLRPPGIEDVTNAGNGRLLQRTDYRYTAANTPFQKAREAIFTYTDSPVQTLAAVQRGPGLYGGTFWQPGYTPECFVYECNFLLYTYPAFQSNWSMPASETIRDYAGAAYVETSKTFQYEAVPVHYNPIKVTETTSSSNLKQVYFVYPSDYAAGSGFIDSLKAYHILNVPVETVTCIDDGAGNVNVTKGVITRFQANGKALPASVMGLENPRPIPLASFKFSNRPKGVLPTAGVPGVFASDAQYKTQMLFDRYDAANNLLQQTRLNDVSKSYLWAHTTYPVAEVINAKWNEIYYESFEDAAVSGVVKDSTRTHNGKFGGKIDKATAGAANVQGRALTVAFTTPVKFRYSGWVYSTGPAAKIYLVMKRTGETAAYTYIDSIATTATNSWVFLNREFTVPQDVVRINLQITNTGGGTVWFDDLRLHPSAAMMTTYTYIPLVGMTSQSDANDQVSYYEYDNFGRLIHIRDKNRNILQKIHYAYKRPGDGCTN